jgi:muramoyltetrapeptide carboxypeptidase
MIGFLESEGYRVECAPHAFDAEGYLAGRDSDRAADLMDAFTDPSVDGILCTRGGYGAARLLSLLDLDVIADSGKQFIGFSDITSLHLALLKRDRACLYAPMAITFSVEREPWVYRSFLNAIQGRSPIPPEAWKGDTLVPGHSVGMLVGGCLCLLCDSIGTPNALDTDGRILLIEDVDENPHRVDAMLTHLISCGALQGCRGLVIGEMTNTDQKCDDKVGAMPWRAIVRERLVPLGIPAIVGFPCGHMRQMLSLPLGFEVRLRADEGVLEYLEFL